MVQADNNDVAVDGTISRTLAIVAQRSSVGAAALQRLAQPLREQALQQFAQLTDQPHAARATLAAAWTAAVRTPVAPGLRQVHRDWIEAALTAAPPATRAALAGATVTPAAVWLARSACAGLPSLPPLLADRQPLRGPTDVVALAGARLLTLVSALGADGVVHALGAAALQGCNASVLGENSANLRAALLRLAQPQPWPSSFRRRAVGWLTTAQAATTGGLAASMLLPMVGVRMLATIAPIDRRQLAVRLPRTIGLAIWPGSDQAAMPSEPDCLPWSIVMAAAA